jgi:hypothetical protein
VPEYLVVAYLRDGRFRCVEAALAVLHAAGDVEIARPGTVRRTEPGRAPRAGLERVIWQAIQDRVAPGALAARGPVDRALNNLRRRMIAAGLLHRFVPAREWLPARTRKADKLLADAERRCPSPTALSDDSDVRAAIGMPVALYGALALRELMPRFAQASGLLTHASSDTSIIEENPRGGHVDGYPTL